MGGLYTSKNRSISVAVYGLGGFLWLLLEISYAIVGKCSTWACQKSLFRERVSFRIWNGELVDVNA